MRKMRKEETSLLVLKTGYPNTMGEAGEGMGKLGWQERHKERKDSKKGKERGEVVLYLDQ